MTEILEGKLFLGNLDDANDLLFIQENKIDTIISVMQLKKCEISDEIKSVVNHFHFEIFDRPDADISQFFESISKIIKESKCVLVHCYGGISRSATCVIAYLMMIEEYTYFDAWKLVHEKRPIIKSNDGFVDQLLMLEFMLYGKNTIGNILYQPPEKSPDKWQPPNKDSIDFYIEFDTEHCNKT
jgi:protein-tyrosine phosphatase